MSFETSNLTATEQRAIFSLGVLAAFADGAHDDGERSRLQQIAKGFPEDRGDLALAYQDTLAGRTTLTAAAGELRGASARSLAYEMAVCVCQADGALNTAEQKFLAELRAALQLEAATTAPHAQAAEAIALQPLVPPVATANDSAREAELDRLIVNAAILNGALEIMPHSLATMAIVPLQMRMVYRIGQRYGYELDRGHLKDFLATVGVGLTSQVFEGFAERLVHGFTRRLVGGLLGRLAGQAAGSAIAFATTYALGQSARKYYAGGRTLSAAQLKDVFSTMLQEARGVQGRYAGDITARSRSVNPAELLPLVRES